MSRACASNRPSFKIATTTLLPFCKPGLTTCPLPPDRRAPLRVDKLAPGVRTRAEPRVRLWLTRATRYSLGQPFVPASLGQILPSGSPNVGSGDADQIYPMRTHEPQCDPCCERMG